MWVVGWTSARIAENTFTWTLFMGLFAWTSLGFFTVRWLSFKSKCPQRTRWKCMALHKRVSEMNISRFKNMEHTHYHLMERNKRKSHFKEHVRWEIWLQLSFQKYNRHNLLKAFYDLTLLTSLWCCLTCLEFCSPGRVSTFPWICHIYLPPILFTRLSLTLKYFLSHSPTLPTFLGQLPPRCFSLLMISPQKSGLCFSLYHSQHSA